MPPLSLYVLMVLKSFSIIYINLGEMGMLLRGTPYLIRLIS